MFPILSKNFKLSDIYKESEQIPYIELIRIMKDDIIKFSNGKYTFEEIVGKIIKNIDNPNLCRRYINDIQEELYEDIENKLIYNPSKKNEYIGMIKSLQYDLNRIIDFVKGNRYILKTQAENIEELFSKTDYSLYTSLDFLKECESMSLCFQLKDSNKFTNIVAELGNVGVKTSYRENNNEYTDVDMRRLSISAIQDDSVVLLGEYEFSRKSPFTMFVLHKCGTPFCRKRCNIRNPEKINFKMSDESIKSKFDYEIYCRLSRSENSDCFLYSLNPFNMLYAMAYAYQRETNREQITIDSVTEKKFPIGKIETNDSFDEYKIISVTPNYIYVGENESLYHLDENRKSPIMHTRRGTPEITNKYGTTYSRRGTVVNATHKDEQPKIIYKV